ncbi:MAG TPA: prolyl aminopeptidase [Burkholderiales bacterium]|nr:prolyl aminopeptidase [Burkholderiales bacterium]
MVTESIASDLDWKYKLPTMPIAEGHLSVSANPRHSVYWHEYGNPDGECVLFIHGGPGGGTSAEDARFFNPKRYRAILFDQRGCGRSSPNIIEDPVGALLNNTTDHLIQDIEALRLSRGIDCPLKIFGGSWGSTLALAYAMKYPLNVEALILRGIFLCRKKDIDYIYQGNAAKYDSDPFDTSLPGTYLYFPEAWRAFVGIIEPTARKDMVAAYSKILLSPQFNPEFKLLAAQRWSAWEGAASYLSPTKIEQFLEPNFAMTFALIENHYFSNTGFLSTPSSRNYLIENANKLSSIPVHIVQGRYDQLCPRAQADELVAALGGTGIVNYVLTTAGHSANERETVKELTYVMDYL